MQTFQISSDFVTTQAGPGRRKCSNLDETLHLQPEILNFPLRNGPAVFGLQTNLTADYGVTRSFSSMETMEFFIQQPKRDWVYVITLTSLGEAELTPSSALEMSVALPDKKRIGTMAVPWWSQDALNPRVRCPTQHEKEPKSSIPYNKTCDRCTHQSASLPLLVDRETEAAYWVVTVKALISAANFSLHLSRYNGSLQVPGNDVYVKYGKSTGKNPVNYTLGCGGFNIHYFDLDFSGCEGRERNCSNAKPQTVVITTGTEKWESDDKTQLVLYMSHNARPTPIHYDVSMKWRYLGRMSFSTQGSAIGTRLWQDKLGKRLQEGRYYILVGLDVWRGDYQRGIVDPTIQEMQNCCVDPVVYNITIKHQIDNASYTISLLFPILAFALPYSLILAVLYSILRQNQLMYTLPTTKHYLPSFSMRDLSNPAVEIVSPSLMSGNIPGQPTKRRPAPTEGGNVVTVQLEEQQVLKKAPAPDINKALLRESEQSWAAIMNFVATFVFIPTFQFVFLQQALNRTTVDICHFNYLCKRDYWLLSYFEIEALNNVYSNLVYIISGFFLFAYVRMNRNLRKENIINGERYGAPVNWGLFEAIALAIAWEGVGSACFHYCPTYWNFQFDTVMMVFIGTLLCAVTVTKRDPNALPPPHTFFTAFAFITCFNLFGAYMLLDNEKGFTTDALWIYIPITVAWFVVNVYVIWLSLVHDPVAGKEWVRGGRRCCNYSFCASSYRAASKWYGMPHFYMAVAVIASEWAIVGLSTKASAQAPLFFLCSSMMVLFFLSMLYLYRKFRNPFETIRPIAWFLFLGFIICCGVGGMFLADYVANNRLEMDESRDKNQECRFLFYDVHDIWHFISSMALTLVFLFAFHVDDDLNNKKTSEIKTTWSQLLEAQKKRVIFDFDNDLVVAADNHQTRDSQPLNIDLENSPSKNSLPG
eukprot:g60386.t1